MNNDNIKTSLTALFYFALASLYVVLGAAVLFVPGYLGSLPMFVKSIFGVACVAYGLFRIYRAYHYFKENYEQE